MRMIKMVFSVLLIIMVLALCTGCSGLDSLSADLKGGIVQLSNDIAIGQSTALITPYQSFEGIRTMDNTMFQATYQADVVAFEGQDILVGDAAIKEQNCRELMITYDFNITSGNCKLIYISPYLEESVLAEGGSGSISWKLHPGANYIGIVGDQCSGSIHVTVE